MMKCSIQWNSLQIVCCKIGNEGMAIIQQFFLYFEDKFVSLEHIHLELNNLSSFWGTCLDEVDVNESNTLLKVQSLDLHNNQLCDKGMMQLANVMLQQLSQIKYASCPTSHTTEKITLKNNSLNFSNIIALQKLDLSQNHISCSGAVAISDCLKNNCPLLQLSLAHNEICDEGIQGIAGALKVNTRLQKLDISCNNIHDQGVVAISECLLKNSTLLNLEMDRITITDRGAEKIGEMIYGNKSLQKLAVSHSKIPNDQILIISNCLKYSNTLTKLEILWNSFPRILQ